MASPAAPMTVDTKVELANLGIPPASMAFTHVTMQGEKYVCVRETGTANNVVIIDTASPNNPTRRPITADSAIVALSNKIVALKAWQEGSGDNLQVFNLDTKAKLKTHLMPERVAFWTWLSDALIGIVTDKAVWHWNMSDATSPPEKKFDRTNNLASAQIISYRVTEDQKWCTLVGIAPGTPEKPSLVKGFMQLFSVEQNRSQALEAHTAAFSHLTLGGVSTNVIAFSTKTFTNGAINSKIHVIALGGAHKKQAELFFPDGFSDDFPVAMQISEKFGFIFVVTKMGLLFVYDLENLTAIYRQRISADPVFLAQGAPSTGGVYVINRRGAVLHVTVNPETMVPFISQSLKNVDLAIKVATRGQLPGAEGLFLQQFERQFSTGLHREAAETAANAPGGVLRTQAVISRLQTAPTVTGQKSPLLVYFGILLGYGPLNEVESVEMARLVIAQNRKEMLGNWITQNKLTPSEALGDIIKDVAGDSAMALTIYKACGASQKEVICHAEQGDIQALSRAAGANPGEAPNYSYLLQTLLMTNPQGALALAKAIIKQPGPPMDVATIGNEFISRQLYSEATSFMLEALADDKASEGPLQTKIIEVNLMFKPEVADAILSNNTFSHYDHPRIAQLCEKAGLYMRALQHYTDLTDIKRCIVNTHAIDPSALLEYFGSLSADWGVECLSELLTANPTGNLQLVVNISKEYSEAMGVTEILAMFDAHDSAQGTFLFLGSKIADSESEEEHYEYIVAAVKCNQLSIVEKMTRESQFLPKDKVKGFLMDAKLPDARPLINVCDRFDMIEDLTKYLYESNMLRYIEGYVQKVNPTATPKVVGGLLDCGASDDFISSLIMSVRSLLPVDTLCEEVEKRNRLRLLTPFLELCVGEGSTDSGVHNAMGKILIDTNNNPEHFLQSNPYYDSKVVGKYCEKRDPHMACVAYKRGLCDDELVSCTNRNSLFKLQARYLVERQNADVYAKVLQDDNKHRRALIDQLVSTALPESKHPEMVSSCVKAFMKADMQSELIELLEKIVLQNSAFSSNANLQNLLIITAIKSDPTRVLDYIHRLDGFEAQPVADIAMEFEQFDAAFAIYKKAGNKIAAITVLLDNLDDVQRAHEYATKVDDTQVWSTLGHAQLERGSVSDAIAAYLLAKDTSKYLEVIAAASETQQYEALVKYLMMVRKRVKDQTVDSEIVVAYAKTSQLAELENFIAGGQMANMQQCGDRCFADALYEAARILYTYIPNYGKLASTLVHLARFQEAVDAARKANSPVTWKAVCFACVEVKEFKLAQLCGLNIIVSTDELDEVTEYYQYRGHFDQLIALLESGIGLERAHMGIFTELGLMYADHAPTKLMEHLKLFSTRVNIPRLIRACEQQQLWNELTFLYEKYDEFDNALNVVMQHSPAAWKHVRFKDIAVKCSSADIFYKAIAFYLDAHPELLSDLLKVLEARIDHSRVVDIFRRSDQLPVIKDYLASVQKNNLPAVNEAFNGLLVDEEDYKGLRSSIEHYDNFDQLLMAGNLQDHELIEFRRIAAFIYKRNLKWSKAVELAKKDALYQDAMETAAQSGDQDLVEGLLRFFVQEKEAECFSACLYTCGEFVKPDVALELAWVNQLMGWVMPYMIQCVREYTSKVDTLMLERKEAQTAVAESENNAAAQEAQRNAYAQLMPLALPAPPTAGQSYGQSPTGYGAPPTGYSQAPYAVPPTGYGAPQPYM